MTTCLHTYFQQECYTYNHPLKLLRNFTNLHLSIIRSPFIHLKSMLWMWGVAFTTNDSVA